VTKQTADFQNISDGKRPGNLHPFRTAHFLNLLYINGNKSYRFPMWCLCNAKHAELFEFSGFLSIVKWKNEYEKVCRYHGRRHVILFLSSTVCNCCQTRGFSHTLWTSSSIPEGQAWKYTSAVCIKHVLPKQKRRNDCFCTAPCLPAAKTMQLHCVRSFKNEDLPYPYSYMYAFGVNLRGKALLLHNID
jgi:hypothetical protein